MTETGATSKQASIKFLLAQLTKNISSTGVKTSDKKDDLIFSSIKDKNMTKNIAFQKRLNTVLDHP